MKETWKCGFGMILLSGADTRVCTHVETTGQHWIFSPVALLSTLVTETSFLTKLGVYQLLDGIVNNSRGWSHLLLPGAGVTGTLCWSLPWEIGSKPMLTWPGPYDSYLFRSCILYRSNINVPWVHTLPSRKKYSELVGGSQEYGQEKKKNYFTS